MLGEVIGGFGRLFVVLVFNDSFDWIWIRLFFDFEVWGLLRCWWGVEGEMRDVK